MKLVWQGLSGDVTVNKTDKIQLSGTGSAVTAANEFVLDIVGSDHTSVSRNWRYIYC